MARNVNVEKGKQGFQPGVAGKSAPTAGVIRSAPSLQEQPDGSPPVQSLYEKFKEQGHREWTEKAPFPLLNATRYDNAVVLVDYELKDSTSLVGDRERPITVRQDSADLMLRAVQVSRTSNVKVGGYDAVYVYPAYEFEDGSRLAAQVHRTYCTSSTSMGRLTADGTFVGGGSHFGDGLNEVLGEEGCPLYDHDFATIDDWTWQHVGGSDLDRAPHILVHVTSEEYEVEGRDYDFWNNY